MPDPSDPSPTRLELRPCVASTALAELLTGRERVGHVIGVSPAAVYVVLPASPTASDEVVVAVETAAAVGLPNALMVTGGGHPFAGLRTGMPASLGHGVATIGPLQLSVARWRDPRPRLRRIAPAALAANTRRAAALLPAATDPVARRVEHEAARLAAAAVAQDLSVAAAAVEGLVGLGPGSTPSGDDVLAGFVAGGLLLAEAAGHPRHGAWCDDLGDVVTARADGRTSALSADLLRHARHGRVAAPAADVLHALTGAAPLARALERLYRVGHTSGRDLALGLVHAANTVATVRGHAEREPLLTDTDGRP